MADANITCRGCGGQFERRCLTGRIPKFCNSRCQDRHRRKENTAQRLAIERKTNAARRAKAGFREISNAQAKKRKINAYRSSNPARKCEMCGVEYCNVYGKQSFTAVCSDKCSQEKRRRGKIRKEKARRMRKRGVQYEIVDPFKVFERDKWICQICGISTPIELRGSINNAAPELDHIVALASNGSHTYANTQCACRKCNRQKWHNSVGTTDERHPANAT